MTEVAPGTAGEGERWARQALDELRASRFSGRAIGLFLLDSFERARLVRGRRPALVRRSRLLGAAGAVGAAPLGARPLAWWMGWWAMLDWHLGMVEGPHGEPRNLGAGDGLTLARLWAAPLVRREPTPWLVLAGLGSDLLDGPLARRAGSTRLGRDFDTAADLSFGYAALAGAVERRGLPSWLLGAERARGAIGAAVSLCSYFGTSVHPSRPRERRLAAVLAGAGALLAASGRARLAEPLLGSAIGLRTVDTLRGLRPERP